MGGGGGGGTYPAAHEVPSTAVFCQQSLEDGIELGYLLSSQFVHKLSLDHKHRRCDTSLPGPL